MMMRRTGKWFTVLVLLAGVLALTGCNKLRARDEVSKGVRAYKAGNFENAIEHFRKSIEYDPELLNAQLYLATAYATQFVPNVETEQNERIAATAIAEFEKALESDPGNITALGYIAQIYYGLKEFDKAKETRRKLIEVDPQNPAHYYSIGVIVWGQTYPVRMTIKNKMGLSPELPLPRRERRRLVETNTELVEEGLEAIRKAYDLNPKDWQTLTYYNLLLREKADLLTGDEREELLQQADAFADRAIAAQKALAEQPESAPAS